MWSKQWQRRAVWWPAVLLSTGETGQQKTMFLRKTTGPLIIPQVVAGTCTTMSLNFFKICKIQFYQPYQFHLISMANLIPKAWKASPWQIISYNKNKRSDFTGLTRKHKHQEHFSVSCPLLNNAAVCSLITSILKAAWPNTNIHPSQLKRQIHLQCKRQHANRAQLRVGSALLPYSTTNYDIVKDHKSLSI